MVNYSSTGEDSQWGRPFQKGKVFLIGGPFVLAVVLHPLHLDHKKYDVEAPEVHAEVGHQRGNTTPSDAGLGGGRIVVTTSTSADNRGNTLRSGDLIAFIRS